MSFDTGNLLTFLLVIAGFIGVYLHSRAVKIAERELEIKVVEINDLIHRLEEERKQREKETNDRLSSQVKETAERYRKKIPLDFNQLI